MASYHCTVSAGAKGGADAHGKYVSRLGEYSKGEKYEDLEATAYGNMPDWAAHNPSHFWKAADEFERANGTAYREIQVALPRELTPEQRLELVEDFIRQEIGDKHAYQFAIHTPKAALEGGEQSHGHIMYSERTRDGIDRDPDKYFKRYNAKNPEKGGCKKASGGKLVEERKAELVALRGRWAEMQNKHLDKHGYDSRVDHRSLKDQGINREPEKHLGSRGVRELSPQDINALLERRTAEGEHERAGREVSLIDLSGDITKAKAERDHQEQNEAQAQIRKLKAGLIPTERLVEPVLRQEVRLPPQKPELSPVELAEQTRGRFFKEAREIWQKETASRYSQEAEGLTKQYWKLKEEEPKEPLLFKKKEWQRQHGNWADKVNGIAAEVKSKKQIAEVVNSGKFEANQNQIWGWSQKAQERLENERPELAQALKEKRLTEQQEAKEKTVLDKAVSDFKVLATKREGKFLGYQDGGKKWETFQDGLKASIDNFNKLPKEARPVVLERMRENMKRDPGAAERLTEQLEQAKGQDKGMER